MFLIYDVLSPLSISVMRIILGHGWYEIGIKFNKIVFLCNFYQKNKSSHSASVSKIKKSAKLDN